MVDLASIIQASLNPAPLVCLVESRRRVQEAWKIPTAEGPVRRTSNATRTFLYQQLNITVQDLVYQYSMVCLKCLPFQNIDFCPGSSPRLMHMCYQECSIYRHICLSYTVINLFLLS